VTSDVVSITATVFYGEFDPQKKSKGNTHDDAPEATTAPNHSGS
jgi:hypothetical protein